MVDTQPYDYMHGDCIAMALFLKEETGLPLYGLYGLCYTERNKPQMGLAHVFVYDEEEDKVFDWLGFRHSKLMIDYYDLEDSYIAPIGQNVIDDFIFNTDDCYLEDAKRHAIEKGLLWELRK